MHANIFKIKIITQHTEFNLYGKDLFYFHIFVFLQKKT
jgi:hypothetical protein